MEDKQKILDLLLPALQATRNLSSLKKLTYEKESGMVLAFFPGGCKRANVEGDSGTSMIRDILNQIL